MRITKLLGILTASLLLVSCAKKEAERAPEDALQVKTADPASVDIPADEPGDEPGDNGPLDNEHTDEQSEIPDNLPDIIAPQEDTPEEAQVDPTLNIDAYTEEAPAPEGASCILDYGFSYDSMTLEDLAYMLPLPRLKWDSAWQGEPAPQEQPIPMSDVIAYPEEDPPAYYRLIKRHGYHKAATSLIMPSYSDTLPLFDRAAAWNEDEERCYVYPQGGDSLTQDKAYDLYVKIAELTTGVTLNQTAERRNVVGIRGAHPGQFFYNGDGPNRFNDTLVLLWKDNAGKKHVREFPANTNTGVQKTRKSGQASALKANRHYRYKNGTHKGYNALQINEYSYNTRDDANNNGHIDNDRNGWLLPRDNPQDYDRTGSGHNIHYGKATALETSPVSNWSAGCQVIPGMENWTMFITNAWTASGAAVDYYLVDARDIDKRVFSDCTPDGSHDCPFQIVFNNGSFKVSGTLRGDLPDNAFDAYNCAPDTNESGPEAVYFFTWDGSSTAKKELTVTVSSADGDPDIHLLNADDPNDCITRHDKTFTKSIDPGRYFIIVDTYVRSSGEVREGSYELSVSLK